MRFFELDFLYFFFLNKNQGNLKTCWILWNTFKNRFTQDLIKWFIHSSFNKNWLVCYNLPLKNPQDLSKANNSLFYLEFSLQVKPSYWSQFIENPRNIGNSNFVGWFHLENIENVQFSSLILLVNQPGRPSQVLR